MIFLSHGEEAADVEGVKMRRHVAVYIHAKWRTHMCLRVCVRMCAHMCARVISEIKHPYSRYS